MGHRLRTLDSKAHTPNTKLSSIFSMSIISSSLQGSLKEAGHPGLRGTHCPNGQRYLCSCVGELGSTRLSESSERHCFPGQSSSRGRGQRVLGVSEFPQLVVWVGKCPPSKSSIFSVQVGRGGQNLQTGSWE